MRKPKCTIIIEGDGKGGTSAAVNIEGMTPIEFLGHLRMIEHTVIANSMKKGPSGEMPVKIKSAATDYIG